MSSFHEASSILLALLLAASLQEGFAIKCFTCNSKSDPRCEDPFRNDSGLKPIDCIMDHHQGQKTRQAIEEVLLLMTRLGQAPVPSSSGTAVLPKLNDTIPLACQKMEFEVMGQMVIGRGCSTNNMDWYHPCDTVKLITSDDIVLRYCSLCDTDGCNAAITPISSALSWLNSLIIAFTNCMINAY